MRRVPEEQRTPVADPDRLSLRRMLGGALPAQLIYVAAKLGIGDLLGDDARGSDELAAATDAHRDALLRVMRGLVVIGLCAEADGRFRLTPLGALLRSDRPDSLREVAILQIEVFSPPLNHLLDSVRTGTTSFELMRGQPFFAYLREHPDDAARFDQFMVSLTRQSAQGLIEMYDFSDVRTVVDVGGGYGALIADLLQAYPDMTGIVFDMPSVAADAEAYLAAQGIASRCRFEEGDFFDSVPAGANCYLLSQILHDWDDAQCMRLLRVVRNAMPPHGKLLVIDAIMPDRIEEPSATVMTDLLMLTMTGGRERRRGEFEALFVQTGFELIQANPLNPWVSLIEGRPRVGA